MIPSGHNGNDESGPGSCDRAEEIFGGMRMCLMEIRLVLRWSVIDAARKRLAMSTEAPDITLILANTHAGLRDLAIPVTARGALGPVHVHFNTPLSRFKSTGKPS